MKLHIPSTIKRIIVLIVPILIFVGGALVPAPAQSAHALSPKSASPFDASLTALDIPVKILAASNPVTQTLNKDDAMTIQPKDLVSVDEPGHALIRMGDLLVVEVYRGSAFSISDQSLGPGDSMIVKLKQPKGHSRVTLSDSANTQAILETDFATITTLEPGTDFTTCHNPVRLTCVVVTKGAVEIVGQGKVITVQGGKSGYVFKGQPPGAIICNHTDELNSWLDKKLGTGEVEPISALVDRWTNQPCSDVPLTSAGLPLPTTFVPANTAASSPLLPALTVVDVPVRLSIAGSAGITLNKDDSVSMRRSDAVVVDQPGHALIQFGERFSVDVFRGSDFSILDTRLDPGDSVFVKLKQAKGQTRIVLRDNANARVSLVTDFATITTLRPGTDFLTCHDPTLLTCLVVNKGEVEVVGQGKIKTLREGQSTYILKGQPPVDVICNRPDELSVWYDKLSGTNEIEPLGMMVDRWNKLPCPNHWGIALSDNFASSTNWDVSKTQPRLNEFGTWNERIGGGVFSLQAKVTRPVISPYIANIAPLSDAYVTVQSKMVAGSKDASSGLIFRRDDSNNYYVFESSNQSFSVLLRFRGQWTRLIDWTKSTAIQPDEINQLSVLARGSLFTLFINNQSVGQVTDDRIASGQPGVEFTLYNAGDDGSFEFSNFEVRTPSRQIVSTPTPVASPTPAVPPGFYVTDVRINPDPPVRGSNLAFFATFLNSTGRTQSYRWAVYIFRAENLQKSFGETSKAVTTIPLGTVEQPSVGSWKLSSGGPCEFFIARVGWTDANNQVHWFNGPDGDIFREAFKVCPP